MLAWALLCASRDHWVCSPRIFPEIVEDEGPRLRAENAELHRLPEKYQSSADPDQIHWALSGVLRFETPDGQGHRLGCAVPAALAIPPN
jgi:hypothetical protein